MQFYRLDLWEDDSRRRMRFVKNEYGSSHPEATLLEGVEGKLGADGSVEGHYKEFHESLYYFHVTSTNSLLDKAVSRV